MSDTASILVIDDEENLRRTMKLILQREGYVVTTAGSIADARKCLQAGTFNLVFLDLKLPDANGLTLLPELRSQYPHMPVIILTANDKLGVACESVQNGARDYLLKPVDPPFLLARIKEVLAEA
jgi:DNA-binding response OmpR family regulator